jgi:uncharacterized membrane protein YhhN
LSAYFGAVTVALLLAAAAVALGDWAAVHLRLFRLEYLLKPATLALLVAAASVADLGTIRPWVVAALAFGLLGDVGLMLSRAGRADPPFLAGLGAFLIGHGCYLVAFARVGLHGLDLLAGALVVAGVAGLALPQVLRSAARSNGRPFAGIVAGYAAVLSAMTVLGVGTGQAATAIGAALFLASDTLIARERFVARTTHGPLIVIASYHAAQFLILIGLISR